MNNSLVRIYHNRLSNDKEIYFDGEKLFRKLTNGSYKEIISTNRNRMENSNFSKTFIVYSIEINYQKLLYMYHNNIYNYNDANYFEITTDLGIFLLTDSEMRLLSKVNKSCEEILDLDFINSNNFKRIPNTIYLLNERGILITITRHKVKYSTYFYDNSEYYVYNPTNKKSKYILDGEYYIHRMVARLFVDGYAEGLVVNHKNGKKKDNYYKNLEWVTKQQDCLHAYRLKLNRIKHGTEVPSSKLTDKDIENICDFLVRFRKSSTEIGIFYNVDNSTINDIKNKKTWTHLECVKNLPKFSKNLSKFLEEEEIYVYESLKENKTNEEIFQNLPEILRQQITMSPIIEYRTRFNKGTLK